MLLLVFVGFVALIGGLIGLIVFLNKRAVDRLHAEYSNDPDVEVPLGWSLRMNSRRPHPPARVVRVDGGKNRESRYEVITDVPGLAGRTTLSVSKEGLGGWVRDKLGGTDVQIGDGAFDAQFNLRGSDANLVRDVVSNFAVQQAILDVFSHAIYGVHVSQSGQLVVTRSSQPELKGPQAKELLMATLRLAAALNTHAKVSSVEAK